MSVFVLKIIAVICMTCDHIRYITPELNTEVTRFLGRIAFPIFAFLITEGYAHTKNLKKYLLRLGIFALVSEIPFLLFGLGCNVFDKFELNVIFTLLFGIFSIICYEKIDNKILKYSSLVIIALFAEFSKMDYGAEGIIVILIFYLFKDKIILRNTLFLICVIGSIIVKCEMQLSRLVFCAPYFGGYIASAIIISNYSGKIGKYKFKYFFYVFYPLHMMIIYFAHLLIK